MGKEIVCMCNKKAFSMWVSKLLSIPEQTPTQESVNYSVTGKRKTSTDSVFS